MSYAHLSKVYVREVALHHAWDEMIQAMPGLDGITLLRGEGQSVRTLLHAGCAGGLVEGGRVIWLDGGNVIDPQLTSRMVRRRGAAPRSALEMLQVSRAFTAHQMCSICEVLLPRLLEQEHADLLVAASLPVPFLDPDVDALEAHNLFRGSLTAIRAMADAYGLPVLISAPGEGRKERERIFSTLRRYSDRTLDVRETGGSLSVRSSCGGSFRIHLSSGQTSLEPFQEGNAWEGPCPHTVS